MYKNQKWKLSAFLIAIAFIVNLMGIPTSAMAKLDTGVPVNGNGIVFVDSSVEEYKSLINALPPGTEVVILDSNADGVDRMAEYLEGRNGIASIHIISHGQSGQFKCGNVWLGTDNLEKYASQLKKIGNALCSGGDILIYGCRVGKDEEGQSFLRQLSAATSADIAASNGWTGAADMDGDWELEATVGTVTNAPLLKDDSVSYYRHLLYTLQAGDLAIIGWSALDDYIRFVTLKDIPAGTIIKITDKGWSDSNAFVVPTSGQPEGYITWTLGSQISKGTVLKLTLGGSDNNPVTNLRNETTSSDLNEIVSTGWTTVTDPFTIAGDSIFIYQDSEVNPFFIFGFNTSTGTVDGNGWNTSATNQVHMSRLPSGTGCQNSLTNGTNAIAITPQKDNCQYNGPTSATTAANWLTSISNAANWSNTDDGNAVASIGTSITISGEVAPSITSQPSNQTITAGQTATLTVTAAGDAPLTYQWKKGGTDVSDGGNISGATTDTLTITNAQAAAAGNYTVVVTNGAGNVTSNVATLTVNPAITVISTASVAGIEAPAAGATPITAGSLTAGAGTYTVTNLTWKDSDGTTAATLTSGGKFKSGSIYKAVIELTATAGNKFQALTPTVNAGTAGAGTINVDAEGNKLTFTVTFSATAAQSVTGIAVTTQPTKLTYTAGEPLDLTGLEATLTYNDGSTEEVMFGAFAGKGITTSPTNGTAMIVATHNGHPVTLTCNGHPATTSSLTVNPAPVAPSITTQPSSQTITAGQTATLTVAAAGDAPLTYQWKKGGTDVSDGGNISGATTDTLTITNAQAADAGNYTVVVTNGAGNVTSNVATLTVNPAITVISTASVAGIEAPVAGATPITAGSLIAGAGTYTITSLTWKDSDGTTAATLTSGGKFKAGSTYKAVIELTAAAGNKFQALTPTVNAGTAGAGTINVDAEGNKLTFTVTFSATAAQSVTGIAVTTQPTKLTYTAGEPLDLTGLAVTLTYNDGSEENVTFAGCAGKGITTSPTHGATMVVATHNGHPVTLTCNGHTATTSSLTVNPAPVAPSITSQPSSQTITAGQTVTLTVAATGDAPLTYQWKKGGTDVSDGGNISGATTDTLTITNAQAADAGNYTVVITNGAGDVTSNVATLTVNPAVPSAPIGVMATGGNAKVTLNWSSVSGATGYKIYQSTTAGSYESVLSTVGGSVYSYEATGLTNGVTYYFVIKATNAGGESPNSAEVSAVPKTVPGAPTNVSAIAGNGQATVSFSAPTDNGGSPITGYVVTSNPGNITATGTGTSITVAGLTNGTSYTFTVKAVNVVGNGLDSAASNAINPYAPLSGGTPGESSNPSTPTIPTEPTKPSETGVEILVNGKTETAATATTTKVEDKTVTTVTIDDKKVEEKLQKEGNNTVVTIPVKNDADVVVGQLNGQTVKNMESKEAVLEIKTGNVTYTLPASQINIDNVSLQIGKQVELKDIAVNVKISAPSQETEKIVQDTANKNNYQVVVKPVDFEITCTSESKAVEVSKFNGYVERMVAIPEGVDPSKITTGIVLNPDGTFSHVPTAITVIEGKYYAKINSLTNSTYSVIWSPKTFNDVENHWAKYVVNDMGSRLIIGGVGEDRFGPDRDITRAEFSAIVVRALGLMRPGTGKDIFTDVTKEAWYYDAVCIAYEYGIISGYGNGKFGPMDKITREQAMTILAKAMKMTGLKVEFKTGEVEQILTAFGDSAQSVDWAKTHIAACIKAGIVSGKGNKMLAPKDAITRAEVAATVRKLLQNSKLIN
ncbi:MAG: DUF4347 domain-containing protein [Clostridia bacterium]|nr:DUF4347 domain-containing protein [Clostridia bacterium]